MKPANGRFTLFYHAANRISLPLTESRPGKTRFGYVYGYQYMEVRNRLAEHKAVLVRPLTEPPARCRITLREWMMHWMENEMLGSVKASSYQTYLTQINKHTSATMNLRSSG